MAESAVAAAPGPWREHRHARSITRYRYTDATEQVIEIATNVDDRYFQIDAIDWPRVRKHKWAHRVNDKGYECIAATIIKNRKTTTLILSRYLLNCNDPRVHVDHIDRNTANNKQANLRLVTSTQNNNNKGMDRRNKSGVNGIRDRPRLHCMEVFYYVDGIQKSKTFSYGSRSLRTKEQAKGAAAAWRLARDAESGCRNGLPPLAVTAVV